MKLAEALTIRRDAPPHGLPFTVFLACGFTPLHLQAFLAAHLQQALPQRPVHIEAGPYSDLPGGLERAATNEAIHGVAIALEWADLDPRLGFRQLGGWGVEQTSDIIESVRQVLRRISGAVEHLSTRVPVAVSTPTLPLPPAFQVPGWQVSPAELLLQRALTEFACRAASLPNVRAVSQARLDAESAPSGRFDLRAELFGNLPYSLCHADRLAAALARLIQAPPPKKGLITDLDDTLWHGILGDAGPEGICWDPASHHSIHGLYQQLLKALADEGVLIAVASRNDAAAADEAFRRPDLLLPRSRVFPLEVHWGAKSASVARILSTWNVGPDSVVFVDDSLMELEEVRQAHPGLECLQFRKDDPALVLALLWRIRDLFGRDRVSAEDRLRLESIRNAATFRDETAAGAASEEFLQNLNATVTMAFQPRPTNGRLLELVNKTNQFNLNGERWTEAEWRRVTEEPGAWLIAVSYQDKFGVLGTISVLKGRSRADVLTIDMWVMSCRAFARRIEHQVLRQLFLKFDAAAVELRYIETAKNGPLAEFAASISGELPRGSFRIAREQFERNCPPLYQSVVQNQSKEDQSEEDQSKGDRLNG